jgi:hypothetical protein
VTDEWGGMVFRFHSLMADESMVVLDCCRFPSPWVVEEQSACFVVKDHGGQALGYFYFEKEPGRSTAKLRTKEEARRIAANVAKLPELLRKD